MKTLLRIDASARVDGSRSRRLADYAEAQWRRNHPDGRVVRRDVGREPVPHVDASWYGDPAEISPDVEVLIRELEDADTLLVSSPMYNLACPTPLKAYFDRVVRRGRTFAPAASGFVGLLEGRSAVIVAARGGSSAFVPDRFHGPYLEAILGFMGIAPVQVITVERTVDEAASAHSEAEARAAVDRAFS